MTEVFLFTNDLMRQCKVSKVQGVDNILLACASQRLTNLHRQLNS